MGSAQHKSDCNRLETPTSNLVEKNSVYCFQPFNLKATMGLRTYTCGCPAGTQIPKPRSGHRVVCDDNYMFSFGGYNPSLSPEDQEDLEVGIQRNSINAEDANFWSESKPLFRELWKYNISTSVWERLEVEQIPDTLASSTVILSGNILIVFGGTGIPFGLKCSNDLYICNLKSMSSSNKLKFTTVKTTGDCPAPQYGQATVLIGNYLYTIGGTTGFEYSCDIHKLHLSSGVWEEVYICKGSSNEPRSRYRHEVAYYDNKIFILGGGTSSESFGFDVIFAFNLATNCWEKLTTRPDHKVLEAFPVPRRCHSCVQLDSCVFVIGGFTGHMMLKDIWRLDLNTLQWIKFPRFCLKRGTYFHSSSLTSNGKLISFGGIVQTENSREQRSADIQMSWLCIPKLKEICWEAVLFYYQNVRHMTMQELMSFGLPEDLAKRISLPSKLTSVS